MILPLFFIACDFWSGIRKAKQRGELITSDGWQRTVKKISRYYNMLLALLLIDLMQLSSMWYLNNFYDWSMPLFPWFIFFGVLFVGVIEIKSIIEPANEKEKKEMKRVAHLASAIASHRTSPEEIAKEISKYLNPENQCD